MANDALPDEKDITAPQQEAEETIEVEVVNDTPPEDRNREPLPHEVVKALEDDDLTEYSDKVKKRLSQMKKVWHDERREKEQASREREEALRFATNTFEENKRLKERLGAGERLFIQETTKSATSEVATAKEKLKQAYDSGDSTLIADAQEELTDAKLKLREYQQYRPTLQQPENHVEQQQQAQPARQSDDPKALAWRTKNTWFGPDAEMTGSALGLHEKLVRSGVNPNSEEYYRTIDEVMRKRFPENFEGEPTQTTERAEKSTPRRAATVVAPATRSTAPRQIKLTATAAALAKKLGLTNEMYAREQMKLESNNG